MKRHLIPLQQQLHHHSFLGSNIAILGQCRPLMNNRDNDREAKRQKLDKAHEELQQPPSLPNSKTGQEEQHRMDILSSAASMFSTRDLIPELFQAKPREQRENEARSSPNDALASAQQRDQDNKSATSASAPNTPFVLGPATRRTSRSVSLCDDDDYKSYQMELPPSVSRSLNNCNICYKQSENNATAPNHLRRCPIHNLPSPPRLPRPEEVVSMVAPLSAPKTEHDFSLFLSTRIYGGMKLSAVHEVTIRIIN